MSATRDVKELEAQALSLSIDARAALRALRASSNDNAAPNSFCNTRCACMTRPRVWVDTRQKTRRARAVFSADYRSTTDINLQRK